MVMKRALCGLAIHSVSQLNIASSSLDRVSVLRQFSEATETGASRDESLSAQVAICHPDVQKF
jgi:hypothetical protein